MSEYTGVGKTPPLTTSWTNEPAPNDGSLSNHPNVKSPRPTEVIELPDNLEHSPKNIKVEENYMSITLDSRDPFERVLIKMVETNRRKRKDYALDQNVFSNFEDTAEFTATGTPEWSALFNAAQKLARLKSLAANGRLNDVQNESVEDTFLDLAVYACIALAIYHERMEGV